MTVKELQEALAGVPDETEVYGWMFSGRTINEVCPVENWKTAIVRAVAIQTRYEKREALSASPVDLNTVSLEAFHQVQDLLPARLGFILDWPLEEDEESITVHRLSMERMMRCLDTEERKKAKKQKKANPRKAPSTPPSSFRPVDSAENRETTATNAAQPQASPEPVT